jgi:hypothetical protein
MAEPREGSVWVGHRLDAGGGAAGKVAGVVGGDEAPAWLMVRTGRLGGLTAVPGADAVEGVDCVWVPYARELVKSAPRIRSAEELDAAGERRLREHYGIG